MAKKLNRNLVGILTLVGMILLAVTGFALLANLPGSDPEIYAADAAKHEAEKKYDIAAQTYVRAYQRDPAKNPEYLVKAAHCALEDGKIGGARELLRNALLRNTTLKSALQMVTDLEFEIAQKFGSSLQWNRVLTEARKLATVDENSALAQHAMGAAYLALQGEDEANRALGEEALKKAHELDPTNAKVVDLLARQLWTNAERDRAAGRIDEAEEIISERDALIAATLEKCRSAAPDQVNILRQLQCVFKIVAGKTDEGIKELEEIAAAEVGATEAHRLLAQIYAGSLGDRVKPDLQKARETLEKALRVDPEAGDVYLELGRIFKRLRDQETDSAKQDEYRQAEVAVYKQGLDAIPRSTHFRKLRNNVARIAFFTELFLADLGRFDMASDQAAKDKALADAESWVVKMKDEADPDSVEVRFLVANLHTARGNLVDATKEAEAAERAAGTRGHLGIQILLAELYGRQQQWGASEQALKKAISMNPDSPGLHLRLAQVLLQQNKATDALVLLKPTDASARSNYLRTDPQAARLRVEALRQLGQYEQALEETKRAGGAAPDDELRTAQLLLMGEKFDEAEARLKALLEKDPKNVFVVRTLAKLYHDTNRRDEAMALVKSALQADPENRMLKLTELDIMEGGDPDARKQRALEIIQEEKDAFVRTTSLFDFHFNNDNNDEARKAIDAAEKLQPENPAVIERQFRLALVTKDWARAETYAKKNGEKNIDGTEGALALGRLALARGEVEKAIDIIRGGLQKYPSNSLGWTILAEAYQQAGRAAEARNVLIEALRIDPTNGFANRNLAEICLREGNEADARKYLAAAERALPNDPFVRRQLQIMQEKENPRDGIASRERLRQENPKDLQNLVLLARLYALPDVAQFDKAAEIYRAALDQAPDDLALAYELASFLGRPDVNRPSEGDALLVERMTREEDKSKKALIATYLGRFYESQKILATADRHFRLAVSLNPSQDILTAAGEYYARTNRFQDAIEYYDRTLKQIDPTDPKSAEQTRSRIIALCLAIGDLDRARSAIDEFLEKYPENQQGMIYEGAYHRIAGDVQQAKRSFDSHLERNPDNAVALWQRGELFRLMGRWQKAIEDLQKAKTFNPNGFSYQHRISLADTLMEINQSEAAVSELRAILDEHPDEEPVAEALIDTYRRIGPQRYPDAETLIYTYMQKRPRDQKWPMLLGRLAESAKDLNKAIQAYQKAAELSRYSRDSVEALFRVCRAADQPKVIIDYAAEKLSSRLLSTMPSALATVAWAYLKTGDEAKAVEFYDQALIAADRDFSVYTAVVGEIVRAFGKEKALEREQKRADADPENVERLKILVHLLQLNDKVPEALAACEKVGQISTKDTDIVFSLLGQGMLKQRLGEYEAAREKYEAVLKIAPENPLALNNLASMLCDELNRPAEALPYAQKARKARPNDQDILDTLGWALTLNDRTGEALGVFLRSLEVNREHVVTLYHLGLLHQRRKEYEEAERRLDAAKKAAEAQGGSPYLSNIDKALQEVRAAKD
ncbi:MAG: hypothetical protein DCC65_06315 [Planctomycetota bacterium]|nr:MAG: hypothetical protein DCC65_06315 [Planctomycetota bacterium]